MFLILFFAFLVVSNCGINIQYKLNNKYDNFINEYEDKEREIIEINSLDELIIYSLNNNKDVYFHKTMNNSFRNKYNQSHKLMWFNPQVNIQGGLSLKDNITLKQKPSFSISVDQPISFNRNSRILLSEYEYRNSIDNSISYYNELIIDIRESWYNLILSKKKYNYINKIIDYTKEYNKLIKTSREYNHIKNKTYYDSVIDLSYKKILLYEANSLVRKWDLNLREKSGIEDNVKINISNSDEYNIDYSLYNYNEDYFINRLDIKLAKNRLYYFDSLYNSEVNKIFPDLSFSFTYRRQAGFNSFLAGIRMKIPIWNFYTSSIKGLKERKDALVYKIGSLIQKSQYIYTNNMINLIEDLNIIKEYENIILIKRKNNVDSAKKEILNGNKNSLYLLKNYINLLNDKNTLITKKLSFISNLSNIERSCNRLIGNVSPEIKSILLILENK